MAWDENTYRQRIESESERIRHPAGSPSGDELVEYGKACDLMNPEGTVLVLGMTPELRVMAASRFPRVISIDSSEVAIDLFTHWIPVDLRSREKIIKGCWTRLSEHLNEPVTGILGDGIIGNLPGGNETLAFMKQLRRVMAPGGVCAMRNIVLPPSLDTELYRFDRLLEDYRAALIDEAEFGFTARILGFHHDSYDTRHELLDNASSYKKLDELAHDGALTDQEKKALARYRFSGKNYFPSEASWRALLAEAGFEKIGRSTLDSKLWHRYYPIHFIQRH